MKQIIMMTKDGCGSCKEFKPKAKEIAQELGYGEKMDELFAGTPPLMVVKLLLSMSARDSEKIIMILEGFDVFFIFLNQWKFNFQI